MVVLHRDQYVDISSAAQGPSSIPPVGIFPPQKITANLAYHASYQFDAHRFKGIQSKGELFDMITSPTCVDGCKLTLKNVDYRTSIFCKCTWSFACSHACVYSQSQQSFDQGLVSKTKESVFLTIIKWIFSLLFLTKLGISALVLGYKSAVSMTSDSLKFGERPISFKRSISTQDDNETRKETYIKYLRIN